MSSPGDRLRAAESFIASIPPYSPPPPPSSSSGPQLCKHAQSFADWCDELVSAACGKRNIVAINQAKVLLLDRYFMWRLNVPLRHQLLASPSAGHVCVFAVFESAYRGLQECLLLLEPPPLALPPAPPQPPPRRPAPPAPRYADLNGIAVAEIIDEEFDP